VAPAIGKDEHMLRAREVEVPKLPIDRLRGIIGNDRYQQLLEAAHDVRSLLGGARIWNLSSTAAGGGVAEMLNVLVGYVDGAGVDVRWAIIEGDPEFFSITKRLHNRLHGVRGDDGDLGPAQARHYESVARANADTLAGRIVPGDIVLVHDPQPAGLAPMLAEAGASVVWRCHIGTDAQNHHSDEGWEFLRPYLQAARTLVFSRRSFAPRQPFPQPVEVIPPSIDPLSPKNQQLGADEVLAILERTGLVAPSGMPRAKATYLRRNGAVAEVTRRAEVIADGGPLDPSAPLVVQVSRWDRLKDMAGVMEGFASHVAGRGDAYLLLVGPAVEGVSDDPEGAEVFAECVASWKELTPVERARVRLVSLPMDDLDENAAMVNAVQRHATIVTQKSILEGFGLTVAEAMWKSRPVVASAVGGIVDQMEGGAGVLLSDPVDVDAFGRTVASLLEQPELRRELGERARGRVVECFLGDRHLLQYANLLRHMLA
jgi:trehalose synthase